MEATRHSSPTHAELALARSKRARRAASTSSDALYRPLVTLLFAVAAGIVADRYGREVVAAIGRAPFDDRSIAVPWFAAWWLLAAGSVALWSWLRSRRGKLAVSVLLVSVASSAAAWHELHWQLFDTNEIGRFAQLDAEPACVEVVASGAPQMMPALQPTPLRAIQSVERTRIDVRVTGIRDGANWRPAAGNCLLVVDGRLADIRAGDRLRVFGQLVHSAPPLNPGEFDFAEHARGDRRLTMLRSGVAAAVTTIEPGSRFRPHALLGSLRGAATRIVAQYVSLERAPLASAILIGDRSGLSNDEIDSYLVTGTVHLLVVSGMNVAILAAGLHLALRVGWIGRRTALAIIVIIVVAYTLLAGWQAPIVRAAVVAILWCVAAWVGRRGLGYNTLAAAALVVLVFNPADLFRAGPQLSFLAVASLIAINDWAIEYRRRNPLDRLDQLIAETRPRLLRAASRVWRWNSWLLITTGVVWLTALPLVLRQFHVLTPVTLVISPAVWIIVWLAMWSGFFMLVFGAIVPPLAALCGKICDGSLVALQQIVHWAESLPAGHFWSTGPATWWIVVFYLGLVFAMLNGTALVARRWQVAVLSAWIAIGCVPPIYRVLVGDDLRLAFVAVGHGTCVVLEGPHGETLLYDAGSLGSPEAATQTISAYLWERGKLRIDGIILSHADTDHYNAVPGLLERFGVGTVYVSPVMWQAMLGDSDRDGPVVLRMALERAGVPVKQVWAGDRLKLGPDVSIEVLHPPRLGVVGNDNANSLTLCVEHLGRRLLLPGDLETPGMEELMAEPPVDCDVLLAPHHGSRRSDPPGFAAWSRPEWVVVSGGAADVSPAVETYEKAGATVVQTHRQGTVEIVLSRSPIQATTWRPPILVGRSD